MYKIVSKFPVTSETFANPSLAIRFHREWKRGKKDLAPAEICDTTGKVVASWNPIGGYKLCL